MMSNVYLKILGSLAIVTLIAACKHGIDIKGQGSVTSLSGNRDCAKADAPCRFDVDGDYEETYTSHPAAGWVHDSWEICGDTEGRVCKFSVPASTVALFEGEEMPSAVARFRRPIDPLFEVRNGQAELPDTPAAHQFNWIMDQLAKSSTSLAAIQQHFHPSYLANNSTSSIRDRLQSLRSSIPNAIPVDLFAVTPNFMRVVIGDPAVPGVAGLMYLSTEYGLSNSRITDFNVVTPYGLNWNSTNPAESELSMKQLVTKFGQVASNTSMLVARIDNDKCIALESSFPDRPQPTASIFKIWVLGALAQGIKEGRISPNTMVPLSDDHRSPGNTVDNVPSGTQFPLRDMAALMIGRSDNTATDHIHALVGRNNIEKILKQFGNKHSKLLTPFLSTAEQFNLLWSVPRQQAEDYANGTEKFQRQFIENVIEPMGPVKDISFSNFEALYKSSWRASAMDICAAYAGLRKFDNRSAAFKLLDQAMAAEAGMLLVRPRWDRVWYKGGSLANGDGDFILTQSWLFESEERGAFVIVQLANNANLRPVDANFMTSIVSHAQEILQAEF